MDAWERERPQDEAEPSPEQPADDGWEAAPADASSPGGEDPEAWEPIEPMGGEPFEALPESEPRKVREGPGRMAWQIILAIAGGVVFTALVFVWAQGADGINDERVLLGLTLALLVILLLELLLLRPIFDALFRRMPASLPVTPDEDNFIVGCPGCGTVFSITQTELDAGSFGCHNCGRAGYIKDYKLNRQSIKEELCNNCGNGYLEYMEHSECPICHTYNEY